MPFGSIGAGSSGAAAPTGWEHLVTEVLAGADVDTFQVDITAFTRDHYMVVGRILHTLSPTAIMDFNGDTANNYNVGQVKNGTKTASNPYRGVYFNGNAPMVGPLEFVRYIDNAILTEPKTVIGFDNAGVSTDVESVAGEWNNFVDAIVTIELVNEAAAATGYRAGSYMAVFGRDLV